MNKKNQISSQKYVMLLIISNRTFNYIMYYAKRNSFTHKPTTAIFTGGVRRELAI